MTKALLPQAFWFRIAAACPRVEDMPLQDRRKRLLDLPASCTVPEGDRLEGRDPWAEVRIGWNPRGMGILVRAAGFDDQQLAADRVEGFADVQLWIDTRDTRDVSRATRFCHRFATSIRLRNPGRKLVAEIAQKPIARAVADPPMARSSDLEARAELGRYGWTLEVFLPATRPERLRHRDESPAGLRLPGLRPHPPGPVPGRGPRLPHRRESEPLVRRSS